ncbi:MAG: hypothetical protein AAGG02_18375 [Cyanobacteria bacterium P01_H01_bin.15]
MKTVQLKAAVLRWGSLLLGETAVENLLFRRNFQKYEQAGVIFIHVPKNAGSSVSYALYGQSLGHKTATNLRAYAPERFEALDSFAILREPVARAYSAWQYSIGGGTKNGWAQPYPEYEERSFGSFETFVREWLPGRDVNKLDFVFQPQSNFVCDDEGGVLVKRLIPLPKLASMWLKIVQSKSVHSRELGTRNTNAAPKKTEFSPEIEGQLRTIYPLDFELYEQAMK